MVKVIKAFELLHPIDKKDTQDEPRSWSCHALLVKGTAALICQGPHPIHAGWYRLQLTNGTMDIEIVLTMIIDLETREDLLPLFLDNPEMLAYFVDKSREWMRSKFIAL